MARTESGLDFSALCAELRKKDEDLLQAASYGKELLEERGRLRSELEALREEYASVHELMQTQKAESQHVLTEVRNSAEAHISDQSQQLQALGQTLTRERLQANCLREEHKKMSEQFQIENAQLKARLQVALEAQEKAVLLNSELSNSFKALEEEKWKLNLEIIELQQQIQNLEDDRKGLTQDLSTLTHACDKLSDDLENVREECEYWENQFVMANEALNSQKKEFLDSQEIVKQLQLQLDQQNEMSLTSNSMSSGISLFDELSSVNHDLMPEELSSTYSDSCEDLLESCCTERSIGMGCVSVAPEEKSPPQTGWINDFNCQRYMYAISFMHNKLLILIMAASKYIVSDH